jgi:hypothetical protein
MEFSGAGDPAGEIGNVRSGFRLADGRPLNETEPPSSMGRGAKSKHCEQCRGMTMSALPVTTRKVL